jgi:hypothetical protein
MPVEPEGQEWPKRQKRDAKRIEPLIPIDGDIGVVLPLEARRIMVGAVAVGKIHTASLLQHESDEEAKYSDSSSVASLTAGFEVRVVEAGFLWIRSILPKLALHPFIRRSRPSEASIFLVTNSFCNSKSASPVAFYRFLWFLTGNLIYY